MHRENKKVMINFHSPFTLSDGVTALCVNIAVGFYPDYIISHSTGIKDLVSALCSVAISFVTIRHYIKSAKNEKNLYK